MLRTAALTNLNQKAAAVQAAIWFFSDSYVLSTSDPLRGTVVDIVNHIRSEGPLVEPPPPSLTLTPSQVSGGAGRALGPFTVTTDHPPATVHVTGGSMFSNRASTVPIADGATVPSGQKIWVRSTGPPTVELQATSKATVPSGNVYLYDGNTNGVNDAQRLILAEGARLTTTVQASADPRFRHPGGGARRRPVADLLGHPHPGQLCGHRDRGWAHQRRLGRRHWQPAHHHYPVGRGWGRPHH